ncbi:MAG: dihydroorotate dehydrogenase [Frankiaceae bacterium]|nr:dihydroorotate dehydrogenase [Frankiaceae bacterium]MBV9869256.1 dihydroorotate dehydrogenase [Frankiaceae bacterium]
MSVTIRQDIGKPRHVSVDMTTSLGPLVVNDPVFTASGCAAAGQELAAFNDLTAIGGVVTKSIQLRPRAGRATPRMAETPSGMLNSIGLQGPGIDVFIKRDLAWLEEHEVTAVVSIAGSSVDDYAKLAGKLRGKPLGMIEVNISCPNVEDRGQVFACDRNAAAAVVSAVRRAAPSGVPVFAKLSPDVTNIVDIAKACVDAGATGLSLINTTLGMVIDTTTMRPILAGVTGGLSGPAIRPMALRCVWQVHEALPEVPIFGIGGIRTGLDAFQFILAGASAVQVGTVIFNDPGAPSRISRELREVLASRGLNSLEQAIGMGHREPETIIPEDPEPPGAEDLDIELGVDADEPAPVETVYIAPDVDEVFDIAAEDA